MKRTDRQPAVCLFLLSAAGVRAIMTAKETGVDTLKYDLLTEIQGRMEAELLQSYLEAHEVPVILIQEAAGHNVYPVMVDGLGRVQVFVPKEKSAEARELLSDFQGRAQE